MGGWCGGGRGAGGLAGVGGGGDGCSALWIFVGVEGAHSGPRFSYGVCCALPIFLPCFLFLFPCPLLPFLCLSYGSSSFPYMHPTKSPVPPMYA